MRKWFVLLFLTVFPLALSADVVEYNGLWYELSTEPSPTAVVISSQGDRYSGDIVIPAIVPYNEVEYTVTTIRDNAFNSSEYLNTVVISEGIQTIEAGAFISCYNMTRVEIPSTVTSIGAWAFAYCSSLATVISNIQEPFDVENSTFSYQSWTVNGVETFGTSSALLYVPSGSRAKYQACAGWNAFPTIFEGERKEAKSGDLKYEYATGSLEACVISDDYSALESVTIPATVSIDGVDYSVKAIGYSAFGDCGSLNSVTFSEGLTSIGRKAFYSCWNTEFSALPSTIKYIGHESFHSCNRITNLAIPEGCTTIGNSAFIWCDGIKRLELPSTLIRIEESAFMGLNNLFVLVSRIPIPMLINRTVFAMRADGSYNDAGDWVTTYTPSPATLYVPDGTKSAYQAIDGWNMFADIVEGEPKEATVDGLTYSYVVGKGNATVISGDYSELHRVMIPSSVTIDGTNYAVKEIGAGAFQNCTSLDTLIMESGVEKINKNAFAYCYNLKSISIPEGVKTIGENAFREMGNWNWPRVPIKIVLPSTVTSIGEYAFSNIEYLSVVVSKIKTPFVIQESTFCKSEFWQDEVHTFTKSEATLYVPDGTKSSYLAIDGWNMFEDIIEGELKEGTYDGLNYSYLVGKGTATVVSGDYSELRKVAIPGSVTFDGTKYTVKEIGAGAFQNCTSLDTLSIESGVETINKYAFAYCYNLKSITISEGVKTIGEYAFREMGNWSGNSIKIVLPSTIMSIGEEAFAHIEHLSALTSKIKTPFAIPKSTFCRGWDYDENDKQVFIKSEATLYVPIGSQAQYEAIEGWNMFADIIEGELKETIIDGINYSYLEGRGIATVISGDYSEIESVTIRGTVLINGTNYMVKEIAASAFNGCGNMKSLVLGEGIEIIGNQAFQYCNSLSSIQFPSTLKSIGDHSFYDCYNYRNIILPEGLESVGPWAFGYNNNWGESSAVLELPSTLKKIGDYAFLGINKLSSVTSRIKNPFEISRNVFSKSQNWNNQGEVLTPYSVNLYVPVGTSSEYKKYEGWQMFAAIYEGEPQETEVGGLKYLYLSDSHEAIVVAGDYSEMETVTIPATVTINGNNYQVKEIGAAAFRDCWRIQSITIENGIEKIGDNAFQWCSSAEYGELPSSIRIIGDQAFWGCYRLTDLVLPEGVQSLGREAFNDCDQLQKVTLPSTISSIGERVFNSCDVLTTVVSHINEPFTIGLNVFGIEDGWNDETQQYIYTPCAATLYVPEGTMAKYKAIEGWTMFREIYEGELKATVYEGLSYTYNTSSKKATLVRGDDYSDLPSRISVPSIITIDGVNYEVKIIDARAFTNTLIASIQIADGIETIGQEAFQECRQLSSISLPSTLTTIEDGVFRYCTRLSSVTIPASVTSIGNYVFSSCTSLTSLSVADGNATYVSNGSNAIIEKNTNTLLYGCKNTVIPSTVTAIGMEAFFNSEIRDLRIPGSVKSIGINAFGSCRNLLEVTLPEGLETIESSAFNYCERLETIEFPTTMKNFGNRIVAGCNNLVNVVSNIEEPKEIMESVFEDNEGLYSRATLWVPKGKINTYKKVEGWNRFENYDELLGDILTPPTISYDGRRMVMTVPAEQKASIYYSVDGTKPNLLYNDTILMSNLGTVLAIAKRFGSYTVDTTRYEITYVFDGVTAKTASGGLLAKAIEWCGADKVEMLDLDGILNDDDFGTIRSFTKLKTLNMAASTMENNTIPSGAFANMKMQWYVSPYTMTSVGSNMFKGCQQLTAITWNSSSVELPEDVVSDVANPNMLVYAKAQAMIPYALKNVIVNGIANNIVLVDSTGNSDFVCPEQFTARRISYTHNYVQQTSLDGETQGWETLALPFTVSKITHETKGEITPSAVDGAEHPFWLYELGDDGLKAAKQIVANVPYLICMPNNDGYGDEYILGGRVTFSAQNVTVTTSSGTIVSSSDRQFVPTYKRVPASANVYAMNVNEVVGGNRIGSAFISNLREVRPFEAYSVHSGSRSRTIPVSSLGGGNATGINDLMLKNGGESLDGVVKVYSLSGALIKQGKRDEVLRSLPKGLYIIDGKKIIK